MSDKLILEEMLLLLKSTVEVYVHGTLESSNEVVRECLSYGLKEIMKMQEEVFNLMCDRNYYKITNVDTKEITKTLKKLESN